VGGEPVDEVVIDRVFHDDAVHGHADLSLVKEFTHRGCAHSLVDIRIGEDDEGTVAAEFQGDVLQVRAAGSDAGNILSNGR
jgi:hypothetical protein